MADRSAISRFITPDVPTKTSGSAAWWTMAGMNGVNAFNAPSLWLVLIGILVASLCVMQAVAKDRLFSRRIDGGIAIQRMINERERGDA